ncbi:MAG: hypothetical protein ACOY93_03675 [Bacillota bacterium]
MQQFFFSERYLRLIELNRSGQHAEARVLVNRALAETEGKERGFWLLVRGARPMAFGVYHIPTVMADLNAALACAPDDPEMQEHVLVNLLALVVKVERPDLLEGWLGRIHHILRQAQEPFRIHANLGMLQSFRGRPGAALRHFNRVIEEMRVLPPERIAAHRGRFAALHCRRALAALECGQIEQAERDVQTASELYAHPQLPRISHLPLALARAGLHLAHHDLQTARQVLQWVRATETGSNSRRVEVQFQAEAELMAGRIALAEGNLLAFEHFARRALDLLERNQLQISAARVRAIRRSLLERSGAPVSIPGEGSP